MATDFQRIAAAVAARKAAVLSGHNSCPAPDAVESTTARLLHWEDVVRLRRFETQLSSLIVPSQHRHRRSHSSPGTETVRRCDEVLAALAEFPAHLLQAADQAEKRALLPSLRTLGFGLVQLGLHGDACTVLGMPVDILRADSKAAASTSATIDIEIPLRHATALFELCFALISGGRWRKAQTRAEEAIAILQEETQSLSQQSRKSVYAKATALRLLAIIYDHERNVVCASDTLARCLPIYRSLLQAGATPAPPSQPEPSDEIVQCELASTLASHGQLCLMIGHYSEDEHQAQDELSEGIAILRSLLSDVSHGTAAGPGSPDADNVAAHAHAQALVKLQLAHALPLAAPVPRTGDVPAPFKESLQLLRDLYAFDPAEYEQDLAHALLAYPRHLDPDRSGTLRACLAHFDSLAKRDPHRFTRSKERAMCELISALCNIKPQGAAYTAADREASVEALVLARRLTHGDMRGYRGMLESALQFRLRVLTSPDGAAEPAALEASAEIVQLRRAELSHLFDPHSDLHPDSNEDGRNTQERAAMRRVMSLPYALSYKAAVESHTSLLSAAGRAEEAVSHTAELVLAFRRLRIQSAGRAGGGEGDGSAMVHAGPAALESQTYEGAHWAHSAHLASALASYGTVLGQASREPRTTALKTEMQRKRQRRDEALRAHGEATSLYRGLLRWTGGIGGPSAQTTREPSRSPAGPLFLDENEAGHRRFAAS
ncbi:hypothetical protein OC844_005069, partial [Tilletia horrida]